MQLDSILYVVYCDTSITISLVLALLFWQRRNAAGAKYMALIMFSVALWGLADFMSDIVGSHGLKIIWDKISYFGVVTTPVAWLAFVMDYMEIKKGLTRRNLNLLFVVPIITLIMLWTNNFHHLMIVKANFVQAGQMEVMSSLYGVWFWVHAAYSYSLLLLGLILFIKKMPGLPSVLRSQSVIILIVLLIPLAMNILFTFKINPAYPIDPTIFSFTIAGILCFFGMFRYKLFELIPAARDAAMENMNGILIVLDNENHIIDANAAAREIIGSEGKNYFGKSVFEILGDRSPYFRKYEHVLKTAEKMSIDTDEGTRHFDLRINSLYDKNKKIIGKLVLMYDITTLEEAIKNLEISRKAAEDASKAKSSFLATMSHEIRTPLNGIIGMAELLRAANLTWEEWSCLETLQSCADSLYDIINDILDFSKIEAGKMELEKTRLNLKDLLNTTTGTFRHLMKEKNIEFTCETDQAIPENLLGDPVRVRQVFVNLIGNAFKFNEEGRIQVSASLLTADGQSAVVRFAVSDTGIGIPEDKLGLLFNSFEQLDSSTTRKYGGTGLGLAIVKNLVTMMEGSIEVESSVGKGSRFIVTIPFKIAEENDNAPVSADEMKFDGKETSILLAEDNRATQLLVTKLLEKKNIKVDVADNGKAAVLMLEKKFYDIILMDIQMPDMDGFEAAAAIRRREADTRTRSTIIALTANATERDKDQCLKSGMNDFLTKPIRADKLYECIYRHMEKNEPGEQSSMIKT